MHESTATSRASVTKTHPAACVVEEKAAIMYQNDIVVWTFDVRALSTNARSIRLPAASEEPVLRGVEHEYQLLFE
jgi:hypothetical protein